MIEGLIETARKWRRLSKLVVTHVVGDREVEDEVRLGVSRGRWKRVAQQLAQLDVVAARGFDKSELVGTWSLPEEPEPDPEVEAETPEMKAHRQHTRWCLEEARRMNESNTKLTTALVELVIDIARERRMPPPQTAHAAAEPQNAEQQSDAIMSTLLTAWMASQGRNQSPGVIDATATETGSSGGSANGPGTPREHGATGA